MKSSVSVIIPCYNCETRIGEAIESVLSQTLLPLEIICVDDKSVDATWNRITDIARANRGIVRAFRHESNKGPAAARNTAARNAMGDWLAFLDADDLWLEDKIKLQTERLIQFPEAVLVHSDCWIQKGSDTESRQRLHNNRVVVERDPLRALYHRNFVFTLCAMVRRDRFEQIGGFDESPDLVSAEDYDLWLRLARRHDSFAYVDKPLAVYRRHESNISGNIRHTETKLRVVEKHRPIIDEITIPKDKLATTARIMELTLELVHDHLKQSNIAEASILLKSLVNRKDTPRAVKRLYWASRIRGLENPDMIKRLRRLSHHFRDISRLAATPNQ